MSVRSVAAIVGSLRHGSYNRMLVRAAIELAPADLKIVEYDIADVPFYNEDVERAEVPSAVTTLKSAIGDADALLLATPEYNYSVPGVLKNSIDWLSRPPRKNVLSGKPVAIIGASQGPSGTMRAQLALRQVLQATNSPAMLSPEVVMMRCGDKFDSDGKLTDEVTREIVTKFLVEFARWIDRHSTK